MPPPWASDFKSRAAIWKWGKTLIRHMGNSIDSHLQEGGKPAFALVQQPCGSVVWSHYKSGFICSFYTRSNMKDDLRVLFHIWFLASSLCSGKRVCRPDVFLIKVSNNVILYVHARQRKYAPPDLNQSQPPGFPRAAYRKPFPDVKPGDSRRHVHQVSKESNKPATGLKMTTTVRRILVPKASNNSKTKT